MKLVKFLGNVEVTVPVADEPGDYMDFAYRVVILGDVLERFDQGCGAVNLSQDEGTVLLEAFREACTQYDGKHEVERVTT